MTRTEYNYKDAAGVVIGVITRIDNKDGTKTFRASAGFPTPRRLYNLHLLAEYPDDPVLVVEGEKAADAAAELLPDLVVVTSPFGAKAATKADWSALDGRAVVIWPDNDAAGAGYAKDVLRLVPQARLVKVPDTLPEGWDLADELPAGMTTGDLLDLLLVAEAPKAKAKKKPSKDDLRKSAEEAKRERDAVIAKILALCSKTVANGCTEAEADSRLQQGEGVDG